MLPKIFIKSNSRRVFRREAGLEADGPPSIILFLLAVFVVQGADAECGFFGGQDGHVIVILGELVALHHAGLCAICAVMGGHITLGPGEPNLPAFPKLVGGVGDIVLGAFVGDVVNALFVGHHGDYLLS